MSRNIKYLYDFPIRSADIKTFLLSAELMRRFGIKGPNLVAVETIVDPAPGMIILYGEGRSFDAGRLIYDRFTDLFAIEKGKYDFVFLSDVNVLGEPVGYCAVEDVDHDLLKFRKIPSI